MQILIQQVWGGVRFCSSNKFPGDVNVADLPPTPSTAWGILVPQPGIEPVPPAVEAQSLNHWIAREFPMLLIF